MSTRPISSVRPPPRQWRRLPLGDLEKLILEIRRGAVRQHHSLAVWREVDRMRKRAVTLQKEAAL
jgi:hypothetical protein